MASAAHIYLNLQVNARAGVKEAVKQKSRKKLPPSTKARWQWKLRLANWLCQLFSVCVFAVEDVKAHTKQGKRLTQSANVVDCTRIKLLRWRTRIVPFKKAPASSVSKERTPVSSLASLHGASTGANR